MNSINPAANQGQSAENGGKGKNDAAGAALIAAGIPLLMQPPTMPMGMMLIAMGILALKQGGEDGQDAGQSGATAASSVASSGAVAGHPATAASPGLDSGMTGAFTTPEGQAAIAAIEQAGGSVSDSGVTFPDGSTAAWSSFSSASAMKAAGMDPTAAMAKVKEIEKKLGMDGATVSMAMNDGGGGGAAAGAPGAKMFANPFALSAGMKANIAAGKTVAFGSDPIGVSMDNIFAMIHRAYVRQSDGDNFIVDLSAPAKPEVASRMPASITSKGK